MNPTRLKEIEKRLEAATPGPWTKEFTHHKGFIGESFFAVIGGEEDEDGDRILIAGDSLALENATLIAHAPEDLRYLLAECRRLRSALEYSNEGLKMWRKYQSPGNIADVHECIQKALTITIRAINASEIKYETT